MRRSTNDPPPDLPAVGPQPTGVAHRIPKPDVPAHAARRLNRLEWLAWLLDRSIPVGRWRIGLDPILGILPGAGDSIGALLSLYVLYEGARLGMPGRVLARMSGNILVETVVGAIPLVGDLFDFAWKANTRNLALIHEHYRADLPPRSARWVWIVLAVFAAIVLLLAGSLVYLLVRSMLELIR